MSTSPACLLALTVIASGCAVPSEERTVADVTTSTRPLDVTQVLVEAPWVEAGPGTSWSLRCVEGPRSGRRLELHVRRTMLPTDPSFDVESAALEVDGGWGVPSLVDLPIAHGGARSLSFETFGAVLPDDAILRNGLRARFLGASTWLSIDVPAAYAQRFLGAMNGLERSGEPVDAGALSDDEGVARR